MAIVCTGSVAFDYLMTFPGYFKDHFIADKLDSISLSFLVDTLVRQPGGIAPNIAYNLALLGEKPMVMATVGEDIGEYRAWLESNGIDTTFMKVIKGKYTASFFANTDQSNAQIASFYTGAMANACELSIGMVGKEKAELVVISANDPCAMSQYVKECRELDIPYLYDPSQQLVRMDREDIRQGVLGAQSVFVNDYEFELLQKHTGLKPNEIFSVVKFMVVTRGNDGASIYSNGQEYRVGVVPPTQILDPTGVGDAFRGGFLKGYRMGLPWQTCGEMGALAATYCLEQRGTQNHRYTRQEFVSRFRQFFDDQGALDTLS